MCLVALALDRHPRFPLVLASNRDEFLDRPSAPLAWWTPEGGRTPILGGRDLQAGGSWLGLTRAGRLALVTNVREPGLPQDPAAPSRGALVSGWLGSGESFDAHWPRVAAAGHPGFNLIAADLAGGQWHCAGRHGGQYRSPRRLGPGLYGLSNAALDTPWPKTERLKARLAEALDTATTAEALATALLAALADPQPAPDAALPRTGVPLDWERGLSSALIRLPERRYGTRCSTLLIAERQPDGALRTLVIERSHDGAAPSERCERLADWPPANA